MNEKKILVVEDEISLQETLVYNLKKEGYSAEAVGDGLSALDAARAMKPDLILLDIMLPKMDGFEVARILRKEMAVSILMLSSRDNEIDRVVGLEIGADDYLTKPFSMRELMARIKAQVRRTELIREEATKIIISELKHERITYENLVMDLTRHEVTLEGIPLQLKPKEYDLLVFFAKHHHEILSREYLLERVWGYERNSRTVDVHIRWLRQKIEKEPANPMRIVTVRGGGYRFEG